jgi:hypothetical protein
MPTVFIVWDFNRDEVKEYHFDTQAEMDAFVYGITEADPDGNVVNFFETKEEAEAYTEEENDDD